MRRSLKYLIWFWLPIFITGCASTPPRDLDNLCEIFRDKGGWYKDALKASKRWGVPIATNMAFIHQESRFVAKAKPPRTRILWIFPGPRKSDAYGYPQAKDATWDWYKKESGRRGADRDDFDDAIDFVAWYNHTSIKRNKISRTDPYHLYLAYHEGHGGFARGSYKNKDWLKKVAKKVQARAYRYHNQLQTCEKELKTSWWWF